MKREIISRKPFSTHPDDHYLEVVLAKTDNIYTPYVTWEYNKGKDCYFLGHYFEKLEDASDDFGKRGV